MNTQFRRITRFLREWLQPVSGDLVDKEDHKWLRTEMVLDEFMFRTKPYLLNRYSLYQLSDESGIPLSDLTTIIDRRKYIGFREFIDEYRIGYCKQLLERIPPKTISLFDLSIICGFADQQEFCAAFKKATHISVTEYVRKVYRGRLSTNSLGATRFFVLLVTAITCLHILKYNRQPPNIQSTRPDKVKAPPAVRKLVVTSVNPIN